MVSQSKSSINIALCLTAMLVTTSTTQAQLSTVPKRYRSELDSNKPKEFGRKKRQQRRQQQRGRREAKSKKQEDDLSMPLQRPGFDMSVPSGGPGVRAMSIPLQELRSEMSMALPRSGFDLSLQQQQGRREAELGKQEDDLSMPLQRSGFDMSVPSGGPGVRTMSIPLQELRFEMSMALPRSGFDLSLSMPMDDAEVVPLDNGSDSDGNARGNAPLVASFLAGISAVVVGSLALFAKMRQKKHVLRAEESQLGRDNMEVREACPDDLIADGDMRDVNII